jgi:hypothetical protein
MEFVSYFKERKNYWLLPTILLLSLVLLSSGVLAFSMSSLNDDIEVYYSFDNDFGNLINNSVDLNDGYSANPSYVSGISGNAFNFVTGVDDTVNFTDPLVSNQSFTVSFWLYLNGTAVVGNPSVLGDGLNADRGFNMLFNGYTVPSLCPFVSAQSMSGIKQGRYCIIDIPNNFTGWKHIVLVFDVGKGGLNEVYVNGNLSLLQILDTIGNTVGYEYNYTTDFQTSGYDFVLGTEVSDPTREFNGYIDEVGIWSKALNQTEVTDLYNGDLYENVSGSPPSANASSLTVELFNPEEAEIITYFPYDLIAEASPSNLNLTNATFIISYLNSTVIYSESQVVLGNIAINITRPLTNFSDGQYLFNVLVCGENDTGTLCAYDLDEHQFKVNTTVIIPIPTPTPTNSYDVIGASGYGISRFFGGLTSSLSGLLLIIAIVGAVVLILGGVVFLMMYAINYAKTR